MDYFLPSWYQAKDSWDAPDQLWYQQDHQRDFDDTISQVRMFIANQQPVCLVVPAYFPNLRYFLYRQKILETKWVSIFDRLQGIPADQEMHPLDYHDFNWPDDADFVSRVDIFQAASNGWRREYLDPTGQLQFIEEADGRVTIASGATAEIEQTSYPSLTDLVVEQVQKVFQGVASTDGIFLAADQEHSHQLIGSLGHRGTLSYFYDRASVQTDQERGDLERAELILVDSDTNRRGVEHLTHTPVIELPPFDTRLSLGTSNQEEKLKIFFMIQGLSDQELTTALRLFLAALERDPLRELTVVTYQRWSERPRVAKILEQLQREANYTAIYELAEEETTQSENDLGEGLVKIKKRGIHLQEVHSEQDIITALRPMRLVVDLSAQPDVFLQIASISAGIPQILAQPSLYVDDQKNGIIIKSIDQELLSALDYYLTGLHHWNEALVYITNRIAEFTGPRIIQQLHDALGGEN